MRIQHNIMAMSAYRNYTNNVSAMKKNLEKLSSGYKINRAGDDAAGLAISEKMRAQITGLQTAQKNAKDGISLVQTAEGALTEVHDMLNRMVELATMSANGTYDVDTDRTQLQKELDQLTEEIDRIASSSNFNGIKLLDGSLGMNTGAIQVGKITPATDAAEASNASDLLRFATSGSSALHGIEGAEKQPPEFKINLGDLKLTAGSTSVSGSTITFTICGETFTLGSAAGSIGTNSSWSASDIADKLATAINKGGRASGSYGWNVNDSGMVVQASANNGVITLTYVGMENANATGIQGTDVEFEVSHATAFNRIFGGNPDKFSVDYSGIATQVTAKGDVNHNLHNVYDAVSGASERAGIDLTINKDLIKDGNTLKIGDTTFEFKVSKDHTVKSGNQTIDLTKLGDDATDEARLREAVERLSRESVTYTDGTKSYAFDINCKNADGGVIHLEQTVADYNDGANSINAADIKKAVSAKRAATEAANAKVEVTVDTSAMDKGNVFTINDKSFEYGKDFNSIDELKTLIEGEDYEVEKDDNTLTISAKTAKDAAPTILGKGLTLQVGDTAEDFNQLKVTVKDCHAKSLGIDKDQISILNEDSAQKAIEKIKSAINYVSDVRGTLGATQNRLDHTINNLSVMTENIQDAESTIRDVDVAEEMMAYTKNNILIQSAQAMLAQANQVPQGVLQLLQ